MQLRPYQIEDADYLASRKIALLAHEMRVGKTACAIAAARKVGAQRVVVLCPAIAVPMWRFQWRQWWPDFSGTLLALSYERGLLQQNEILSQTWDVGIIDECHYAGNPEAQRTKMIYGKGGLVWKCGQLWSLSGTPAPKHAGSLWPLLRAAGIVKCTYQDFLTHYCRVDPLTLRAVGTKEQHIPELRAMWQQIGLRRTRKQVAPDMPDIGFNFLQVEPERPVDLENPGNVSDEALLASMEAKAAIDREDRIAVAMAKLPRVLEEIELSLSNSLLKQTVIFGWHLDALRKAVSVLRGMGFSAELLAGETSENKRIEIQEKFRLGLIDVVVGQIRACGTAIDLSAASHAYMLELDWVPGNNLQAANRLVAIGKDEKVTIDIATMPGSVDDRVQRVLIRRARELNALI